MSKRKARVAVIGHFAFGKECFDGQTVKTKIVTDELGKQLGNDEVLKLDTAGGKSTLLKAPFQSLKALKKAKNVIIFPAHNGVRVYVPLLSFFRKFFKNRKLHYVVIGGWLPEFLKTRKSLAKKLKRFDEIYVETNTMKRALEEQGFTNIVIMPNCKDLKILKPEELVYPTGEPYKLCTFSRVMKEKGIEDAVNVVKEVNEEAGRTIYTLDIFGQVDAAQVQWFEDLKTTFSDYVKYKGVVDYDKSVEVLKNYFALLFPTRFYTEGIPGTIIDAYAAGVPVISAKWESFSDIIDEGATGFSYEFNNVTDLIKRLGYVANNANCITDLKLNCLEKSRDYLPYALSKILIERLEVSNECFNI